MSEPSLDQVNENQIIFFRNGGHTHDGLNSSLITVAPASVGLNEIDPNFLASLVSTPDTSVSGVSAGGTIQIVIATTIAPGGVFNAIYPFANSGLFVRTSVTFTGSSNLELQFFESSNWTSGIVEYQATGVVSGYSDSKVWAHTDASSLNNLYYQITNTGSNAISGITISLTLGTAVTPSDINTVNSIDVINDTAYSAPASGPVTLVPGVGVGIVRSGNSFIFSTSPVNNPTGTPPPVNGVGSLATTSGVDATTNNPYITATWTYPPSQTAGVSYEISINYYDNVAHTVGALQNTTTTTALTYTFANLISGQWYQISVVVLTTAGQQSSSATSNCQAALSSAVPATPTFANTGSGFFAGFKTLIAVCDQIESIPSALTYKFQIDTANTFNTANLQTQTVGINIAAFNKSILANQLYYLRVQAISASGVLSSWSTTLSATTGQINGASDIVASSITAGSIVAGTITGDKIAANTIDAGSIKTNTILASTINLSGAIVASAGSGSVWNTVTLNSAGLQFYTSSTTQYGTDGTKVVDINTNGTASFSGTVSASTITGSTITSSSLVLGTGSSSLRVDSNGNLWSGSSSSTFDNTSPFSVDSAGNVFCYGLNSIMGGTAQAGYVGMNSGAITLAYTDSFSNVIPMGQLFADNSSNYGGSAITMYGGDTPFGGGMGNWSTVTCGKSGVFIETRLDSAEIFLGGNVQISGGTLLTSDASGNFTANGSLSTGGNVTGGTIWSNSGNYVGKGTNGAFSIFSNVSGVSHQMVTISLVSGGTTMVFNTAIPAIAGSTMSYNTTSKQVGFISSSRRYKMNIRDIINGGKNNPIFKLRPVTFKYNPKKVVDAIDRDEAGIIVEEVNDIAPDMVFYDEHGDPISPNTNSIIGYLIDAVQYLKAQVELLS